MTLLAAVEGYYGMPLAHAERLDLVRWLAGQGYEMYMYAPKNDPYHRDRWRDPYPTVQAEQLRALVALGRECGVEVCLVLSPGLDWRDGDEATLATKLQSFASLGATCLGVAWDDVPPAGASLGETHGRAVAAAVGSISGEVRWFTCPTDYSAHAVTPYLRAFARALPEQVEMMWTGPGIVSPHVDAAQARALGESLGRRLLFAENFPVNDGTMSGVLHLGPYPRSDPALRDEVAGVVVNFMRLPRASRMGLAVAARFWHGARDLERIDRTGDWRECVSSFPGLEQLARACRSWAGDPGPDAELAAWCGAALASRGADTRLRDFLQRGCREGLEPALADEVEPWLAQWESEAEAMLAALALLGAPREQRAELAMLVALLWSRARCTALQVFGIRLAYYPVTHRDDDGVLQPDPAAVHVGDNLTDTLCRAALAAN
jgi:hyaluronoglucosaminidase